MRALVAIAATAAALLIAVVVYADSNCFENLNCSTGGQVAAWAMLLLAGALMVEIAGAVALAIWRRRRPSGPVEAGTDPD